MTPLAALTPLQSWLAILTFLAVFAVFVVALWRTDRGWYCQAQHPHPTRLDADLCDAHRYEADRLRRESDAYADAAREGLAAGTWPAFPAPTPTPKESAMRSYLPTVAALAIIVPVVALLTFVVVSWISLGGVR